MDRLSKATPRELRSYLAQRLQKLKAIREPWVGRWQEVSRFISPFNGRFSPSDHQEGRNFDYIYDNVAGSSLDTLVSGLANGATSPVRQWFKVNLSDLSLMQDLEAAKWCSEVERLLLRTFQASNTYNSLHSLYREVCLFGVGADVIYPDPDHIIRHHVLSAGEYCLQCDNQGVVDTLYREFQLTVSQAVQEFGYENVPDVIKRLYDSRQMDERFIFCHAIEPRYIRDENAKDNKNMPWASYYFMESDGTEIISESGFDVFPALCPRWDVLAGETYGISPSITALPNIKQLQHEVFSKAQILDMMINPPIQAPASARKDSLSIAPGSFNFTQGTDETQLIRPIVTSIGDYNAITQDIYQLKQEIKSNFYVDLFLMVQNVQDDRKTAAEIYALKEEKMLVLGSVIERLQHELLQPLVVNTYTKLKELGYIPQPPQSMRGEGLDLEFQSMLAQSQRAVDINQLERMLAAVQSMAPTMPNILDRVDPDGVFDVYRDRLGVDPAIARSVDDAQAIRQQREQAAAQQAEADQSNKNAMAVNQLMQAQKAGADASLATQNLEEIGMGGIF